MKPSQPTQAMPTSGTVSDSGESCTEHTICVCLCGSQETDRSGERRNGDSLVGEDLAGERDQFDTLAGQFVVVGDPVAQP